VAVQEAHQALRAAAGRALAHHRNFVLASWWVAGAALKARD